MDKVDFFIKVERVITGCNTQEQLRAACNYLSLAINEMERRYGSDYRFSRQNLFNYFSVLVFKTSKAIIVNRGV